MNDDNFQYVFTGVYPADSPMLSLIPKYVNVYNIILIAKPRRDSTVVMIVTEGNQTKFSSIK